MGFFNIIAISVSISSWGNKTILEWKMSGCYWISLSQSVDNLWSWWCVWYSENILVLFALLLCKCLDYENFILFQIFDKRHRNVQHSDIPRHRAVAPHGWKGEKKKSIGGRCLVDLQLKYALNLNGPVPIKYLIVCFIKYILDKHIQI